MRPKIKKKSSPTRSLLTEGLESRSYLSLSIASFNAPIEVGGISNGADIATADFNHDNKLDLVVTGGSTNAGTVSLFLGNGDGTFQAPIELDPTAPQTGKIVTSDFNGDGNSDLAVFNPTVGTYTVFMGNGDGTFNVLREIPAPAGSQAPIVAAADLDGDGRVDLVFADSTDIFVMRGGGDGTFTLGNLINGSYGNSFALVGTNVMTGNPVPAGVPDQQAALITQPAYSPHSAETDLHIDQFIDSLSIADFNGDGHPDIIAIVRGSSSVLPDHLDLLLNNGDGTFHLAGFSDATLGSVPRLVTGDFNGDGRQDAVAITPAGAIQIIPGNGLSVSLSYQSITVPQAGQASLASGDFNGDGRTDVAFVDHNTQLANGGGIGILIANSTPVPSSLTPVVSGKLPTSIIAGQKGAFREKLTLSNNTNADVVGSTIASIVLSPASSSAQGDFVLGTATRVLKIKSHKRAAFNVKLKNVLPSNLSPGTYHLFVQVTDPANNTSIVDSGQSISISAPIVNLGVTVKSAPASGKTGKPLNVVLTITSQSNIPLNIAVPLVVDAAISGQGGSEIDRLSQKIRVGPGKSISLTIGKLAAPGTAGSYVLTIQLDPQNTLQDSDTTNNSATTSAIAIS